MDIFKELPFELQSNIFMIYLKKKKEKINKNIIELLKDRSPFYLNSLFQLKDNGGTKKMCICGELLTVDTTNSKDSPCYSSPICMIVNNSNINYKYSHNKRLSNILKCNNYLDNLSI